MKLYSASDKGGPRHDAFRSTLSATGLVISRFEDLVGALCVASMVVFVFSEVILRYVLNMSLAWTEELARLSIVWLTFSAAAIVFRNRRHVRIEVVVDMLAPRAKAAVSWITELVIVGVLLLLVKTGSEMTTTFWTTSMPVTGFSGGLVYLPMPIFCAAMIFHSLEVFVRGDITNSPAQVAEEETQL